MKPTKRIVVQDYTGYPFPVELSRKLAERGHRVLHLYAGNSPWPHGNMQVLSSDSPNFDVRGLKTRQPLDRYAFVKRWFQEREYGGLVRRAVEHFRPDVVISADMPLDAQAMLLDYCRQRRARFIFWLQDIISLATRSLLGKKFSWAGQFIGQYYLSKEKRLLAHSDHVVAITDDFAAFVLQAGLPPDKLSVIPNWAPLNHLPALPKDNPWARDHNLADKFCFLYSGTLGLKHNPQLLLELAHHFRQNPKVVILVCSEGLGADWLLQKIHDHSLTNMDVIGYQPLNRFAEMLAAGDALLAILEADAGVYSVPSKVLAYLAAQRPLLLAVPPNNLAAKIVSQQQAGFVVAPADTAQWLEKADTLAANPGLRQAFGQNGRRYAEDHFDIEKIADAFEALM